jgi:hypothetical protein
VPVDFVDEAPLGGARRYRYVQVAVVATFWGVWIVEGWVVIGAVLAVLALWRLLVETLRIRMPLSVKRTLRTALEIASREDLEVFTLQIVSKVGYAFKDSWLLQPSFGELCTMIPSNLEPSSSFNLRSTYSLALSKSAFWQVLQQRHSLSQRLLQARKRIAKFSLPSLAHRGPSSAYKDPPS